MTEFSIIIPTYNRPDSLKRCLESLLAMESLKEDFEVVIVNDGSKASLVNHVRPYYKVLNIKLIEQANKGAAAARNKGAKYAKGKYFLFTDDDCIVSPDWLECFKQAIRSNPKQLIGGEVNLKRGSGIAALADHLIIEYLLQDFHHCRLKNGFFTSNNIGMSKEMFFKIGGFNKHFGSRGEDRDFCQRWLNSGFKVSYEPSMKVEHMNGQSFLSHIRNHVTNGRRVVQLSQTHATRTSGKWIRSYFFYLGLIFFPFRKMKNPYGFLVMCIVAFYQLLTTGGYIYQKFNTLRFNRLKSLALK